MQLVDTFAPFNNALRGILEDRERRELMDLRRREDARQQGEFEQRSEANRLALRRSTQQDLDQNTLRGMLNRPGFQGDVGGIRDLEGSMIPGTTETGQVPPERTLLEHALRTGDINEAKRVGEFITDRSIGMAKLGDRGGAVRYFQDATGKALAALGATKDDWIETSKGMFNWRSGEWRQAPAPPMSLAPGASLVENGKVTLTAPGRQGESLDEFRQKEEIRGQTRAKYRAPAAPAKPPSGAQLASIERNKALEFRKAEADFHKKLAEIQAGFATDEEKQQAITQAEEDHADRKQQIDEGYMSQRDQFGLTSTPVDYRGQLARKRKPAAAPAVSKEDALAELRRRGRIR